MALGIRKLIVVGLVAAVFVAANALLLAHWLDKTGVIGWAAFVRQDFLTGTAVTILLVLSVGLLIKILPEHKESPIELLRSAASLWITNVLVFASWYWRLDAGGPYQRYMRGHHKEGAFLFPQMLMKHTNWTPHFVDYLFLAFNTSTAFSPTDTYALSRWSKTLMMAQSLISLTVTVLLVARAVNIL